VHSSDEPLGPEEEDGPSPARAGSGRVKVIVLVLSLVAASFGFALIRNGEPNDAREGAGGSQPVALPSNIAPTPTPMPPPAPAGCTPAPTPRALLPAPTVPEPTADYRFQGSLATSVGTAPDLTEIGRRETAFTDEGMVGRTVLSFARRTGLSLAPTNGVVRRGEYTIEILLRLNVVGGFHKIVDLKNGNSDNGLYALDGCLTFFPRTNRFSTRIEPDTYVQVVLTRGAGGAVVAYVDGIRQLVFDDRSGIGEISRANTLRFFIDDTRSRVEHSSGAVSQIRLYDRALSAEEIAALVCSEIRIPLSVANSRCPTA
jgi:hypothetical protein